MNPRASSRRSSPEPSSGGGGTTPGVGREAWGWSPGTPGRLDRLVGDAKSVRELFDAMPVYLVGYDGPEHTVVGTNEACRSLLGRDRRAALA